MRSRTELRIEGGVLAIDLSGRQLLLKVQRVIGWMRTWLHCFRVELSNLVLSIWLEY